MTELQVVDVSIAPNAQYNASTGRNCGKTQLILGVLSIACGVITIAGGSELAVIGYSIWGGAIYCTAGLLGILSYKRTTCVIVGCMMASIISAVCAFGQIGWEIFCATYASCFGIYDCNAYPIVFHSIASVIGLIELFPSIISALNCCRGATCCRARCCDSCIECLDEPWGI